MWYFEQDRQPPGDHVKHDNAVFAINTAVVQPAVFAWKISMELVLVLNNKEPWKLSGVQL